MRTVLWVMVGVDQLFMLLISAVNLHKFELSEFALKERLSQYSGESAKLHRRFYKLLPEIRQLQKVELIIAGSISVGLLCWLNKPYVGVLYGLILFLLVAVVGRLAMVQRVADRLFEASLDVVVNAASKLRPFWLLIGTPDKATVALPASLPEFTSQLRRLPSTVMSPLQRQRLETVLESETKTVSDIMTAKKRVITVEPSATLGPIVLSDLEKSGHGYFPVATKKGEPEGILTLADLADINLAKQRSVVRELMSTQIAWVEEATSLYELAQAFLAEKQYLILVRNSEAQFTGVVTIADLMKHLVGVVKD